MGNTTQHQQACMYNDIPLSVDCVIELFASHSYLKHDHLDHSFQNGVVWAAIQSSCWSKRVLIVYWKIGPPSQSYYLDLQQVDCYFWTSTYCPLIPQVLSSRRIDHDYALALLLMLPPEQAVEKLQRVRSRSASSYSKVIVSPIKPVHMVAMETADVDHQIHHCINHDQFLSARRHCATWQ